MSSEKKSSPSKDAKAPSKDDEVPVSTRTRTDVSDTVRDNTLRLIDEMARVQPQISQSISNLQLDYIQTTKNIIQSIFTAQKEFASNINFPQMPAPLSEQVARQATEITNNVIGANTIYSQMAMKSLDAARENVKIYNKTVNAITDYNTNVAKAWGSFWASQQQFFRA
jgi:hypothetical protein